jgi:hypothetical protein
MYNIYSITMKIKISQYNFGGSHFHGVIYNIVWFVSKDSIKYERYHRRKWISIYICFRQKRVGAKKTIKLMNSGTGAGQLPLHYFIILYINWSYFFFFFYMSTQEGEWERFELATSTSLSVITVNWAIFWEQLIFIL